MNKVLEHGNYSREGLIRKNSFEEGFKLCKNAVQNHYDFWIYRITIINKKLVAKNAHIGNKHQGMYKRGHWLDPKHFGNKAEKPLPKSEFLNHI